MKSFPFMGNSLDSLLPLSDALETLDSWQKLFDKHVFGHPIKRIKSKAFLKLPVTKQKLVIKKAKWNEPIRKQSVATYNHGNFWLFKGATLQYLNIKENCFIFSIFRFFISRFPFWTQNIPGSNIATILFLCHISLAYSKISQPAFQHLLLAVMKCYC